MEEKGERGGKKEMQWIQGYTMYCKIYGLGFQGQIIVDKERLECTQRFGALVRGPQVVLDPVEYQTYVSYNSMSSTKVL